MRNRQVVFLGLMILAALIVILWPPQRVAIVKGKDVFLSSVFWAGMDHVGHKMACPPDLIVEGQACSESSRIDYRVLFLELLIIFAVGGYLVYAGGRLQKWQVTLKVDKEKEWLSD